MPQLVSRVDLRVSAADIVLKLSVLAAVLLLSVTSDNAQAVVPRWCSECLPEKDTRKVALSRLLECTVVEPIPCKSLPLLIRGKGTCTTSRLGRSEPWGKSRGCTIMAVLLRYSFSVNSRKADSSMTGLVWALTDSKSHGHTCVSPSALTLQSVNLPVWLRYYAG